MPEYILAAKRWARVATSRSLETSLLSMVTICNLALICNELIHDEKEIFDWLPANID